MKLVSTVLCCHKVNGQLFTAINSILNQTYTNHELIIIFDNPNQKDFLKIKSHYKKKNKKTIRLYQNIKNEGLTFSLNRGIKLSKGYYIMRQDSDDFSEKNRMQILVNYLENNLNKNLVFSNILIIDDKNLTLRYKKNYLIINSFFSSYNYKNSISHPSIMFRKNIFEKIKYYDERFKVSQDFDLIHRFIKYNRNCIGKVSSNLYNLRYSKHSISSVRSDEQLVNSVIILFKHNFESYSKLLDNVYSTEGMLKIIEQNMKTSKEFSIYYSYLIHKKIPFVILINPFFIYNLFLRFLFHPNLLIKRFFRLI
jgi:glycosyltransferase involved in cell wall biosynthesis